jgi:hypothetical protein
MATYYKYAERGADSQVNWAEVGKNLSDMLSDEVKIREEKKSAYEQAYQDDMKNLYNNPQGGGIWGGNDTINNFSHDMIAQKKIDYDLLKSGKMKPRDYTLRTNNYNSQTETLFDVAKTLISTREQRIKEFQEGKISAIDMSNLNDASSFTDFSKSKIIIDPYSANLNLGVYEVKNIDGKDVPVLSKNMTANQLKAAVGTITPVIDVSAQVAKGAESLGQVAIDIVSLPKESIWGEIKSLTGVNSLVQSWNANQNKIQTLHPELGDSIKKIESAIDSKIQSIIPQGPAQTSAFEKYLGTSASDYTSSIEEAKNDPTKVLKYLDPELKVWTIDPNGPNYKKQVEELKGKMKEDLYSQLDNITKSSVMQLKTAAAGGGGGSNAASIKDRNERAEANIFAGYINNVVEGKNREQNLRAIGSKVQGVATEKDGVYTIQLPSKVNSVTGEAQVFDPTIINTKGLSKVDAARILTSTLNGLLDPSKRFNEPYVFEYLIKDADVIPDESVSNPIRNPLFPNTQSAPSPISTSKYNK